MDTTLKQIRSFSPCELGWATLLKHLGKTQADDMPLDISTILESNGLDDALWCLRAVQGHDREVRLFAVGCARHVQHLLTDPRSIEALGVAEIFANAQALRSELDSAWSAARAAWGDWQIIQQPQDAAAGAAAWAVVCVTASESSVAAAGAAAAATRAAVWAALDASGQAPGAARDASRAAQTVKLIELCGNNK